MLQSGKGVVIIITIVFSCLSFTLGFFVGKFGRYNKTEVPAVITEPAQNIQPQQLQDPRTSLQAEPLKAQPELSGTLVPPAQPRSGVAVPPVRPSLSPQEIPGNRSENGPRTEPAGIEREAVAKQAKEISKTAELENKQEKNQDSIGQKQVSSETLYAVQLGAFKNKAEAEKFRAKYSKKGYKIYIEPVKANRSMKIYKLRTGEFREKKDAEVLAVKLKKNENLKTFVVAIRE